MRVCVLCCRMNVSLFVCLFVCFQTYHSSGTNVCVTSLSVRVSFGTTLDAPPEPKLGMEAMRCNIPNLPCRVISVFQSFFDE